MTKIQTLIFFLFCAMIPAKLMSQTFDAGAITSVAVSKDLGRYSSIKAEEELRFNQNITSFNRSKTTLGLNYSLYRDILMAEVDYNFIYLNGIDNYEFRHRCSVGLSTQTDIDRFNLGFKSRVQTTWRDENRGSYNFNPKYVWRNKIELNYDIFGSPLKPYISEELFCPLNGAKGFYLNGLRTTAGLKYRLTKHNSVEVQLMYDQEIQQANPQGIIYACAGWTYKL